MAKFCIGIDLGGTFIKVALLDEQRRPTPTREFETPIHEGPDAVVAAIVASARRMVKEHGLAKGDLLGVGIGSPGPIDISEGVIITLPNIPGMDNVPLRELVSKGLGLPAVLENDANAAAYGEFIRGAGVGTANMVLLTLGTGVGSGIVVDGKILHGAHDMGGEWGHVVVQPGGEPCACGQAGCLERYSSATYLAQYATRLIREEGRDSSLSKLLDQGKTLNAKDIVDAAKAGDELAAEVWDRATYHLAVACVNISRIFDPDCVVLGGGMARAGDELLVPVRRYFRQLHWALTPVRMEIHLASLGPDAGVIGAAGVAWSGLGDGCDT
ncbi:MAG TPA: ROK family protein [Phycisphaerae bacterium]|nr:ROK family protein [Phycisphaerae bacterium]